MSDPISEPTYRMALVLAATSWLALVAIYYVVPGLYVLLDQLAAAVAFLVFLAVLGGLVSGAVYLALSMSRTTASRPPLTPRPGPSYLTPTATPLVTPASDPNPEPEPATSLPESQ